ncbi:Apoptosis-antagonizing transcription factor [Penicillium alfredii]|uniref:Protein BFR2 n=1 Tax=Penicillium alfredii TaxID=1506179 RepID=A0A9W9EHC7_9EURO|nr:Apoptosis-antagonizing transcription factor [Penicillium alfredii]KAJ5081831.1 Apoptosis-antagonizing transcription factor [Penicillium alfredii]
MAGTARPRRSLADQLAELTDPTPKDFDPEDLERGGESDGEGATGLSTKTTNPDAGREHYQEVGKSTWKKRDAPLLGKHYSGTRVSRDALEEDSDDPFGEPTTNYENSDQVTSEGEASGGESPGSGASSAGDSLSEEGEGVSESEESGDSLNGSEDTEDEDSEDEGGGHETDGNPSLLEGNGKKNGTGDGHVGDRGELRRLMASDQKTIAATLSQAAQADAAKGKAVKEQRTCFDGILNSRIKLQKGLTAVDEIVAKVDDEDESNGVDAEAIKSAESAALTLWSTLEDLRTALADAQATEGSKKRKRPSPVSPSTSSASLWERMADLESESMTHRRAILDKWSQKVRGTSTPLPNARGKLMGSASGRQQTITAVLDAQIATEIGERATKRSRAASQSNGTNFTENRPEPIYDDTVFYQSLLRDLVEQRMSSSDAMTSGLDTLHQLPSRLPIHPVTGMRNDKVKRDIDTRASKGRKMRFNVHEKLQNFMAPEDRGSWTISARDELFASLLGKTASGLLGEGDESASGEDSDSDREEGVQSTSSMACKIQGQEPAAFRELRLVVLALSPPVSSRHQSPSQRIGRSLMEAPFLPSPKSSLHPPISHPSQRTAGQTHRGCVAGVRTGPLGFWCALSELFGEWWSLALLSGFGRRLHAVLGRDR